MQVERGSWCEQSCRDPSGARVSNTWVTCPRVRDTPPKGGLILDTFLGSQDLGRKGSSQGLPLVEGLAAYQLVGGGTGGEGGVGGGGGGGGGCGCFLLGGGGPPPKKGEGGGWF